MNDLTLMDLVNETVTCRLARVAEVNGEKVIALAIAASNGIEVQMVMPLDTADDIMRTIWDALITA